MSDYFEILKHMPLTMSAVVNMHPDGVAPEEGLTSAKLLQMMEETMKRLGPPPPSTSFDLYGHPTITDAYELNLEKTLPELMPLFQPRGRRTLIVPKDRLESIARTLRDAGADVRIEPRYGAPSAETQGVNDGN